MLGFNVTSLIRLAYGVNRFVKESLSSGVYEVRCKSDGSCVTSVDMRVGEMVSEVLHRTGYPVVSEEGSEESNLHALSEAKKQHSCYWLVDPVDGTSDMMSGGKNFTLNIALMQSDMPVFGFIHHFHSGMSYFNNTETNDIYMYDNMDEGSDIQLISRHNNLHNPPLMVCSPTDCQSFYAMDRGENLPQQYMDMFKVAKQIMGDDCQVYPMVGAMKFIHVINNNYNAYLRFSPSCSWDVAAGHALLRSFKGRLITQDHL